MRRVRCCRVGAVRRAAVAPRGGVLLRTFRLAGALPRGLRRADALGMLAFKDFQVWSEDKPQHAAADRTVR